MRKIFLVSFFLAAFVNFGFTLTDTFYVNKVLFKIDNLNNGKSIIQKFQHHTWTTIDTFDTQPYKRNIDIDKNGFSDIAVWWKLSYDVFLFDPLKNSFVHSGNFSTIDANDSFYYSLSYTAKPFEQQKMQLLNKELHLYYNFVPEKRGWFYSELFQLKDYKKIVLGTIYQFAKRDSTTNQYLPADAEIRKHLQKTITYPKSDAINGITYQRIPKTEVLIKRIERAGAKGIDYANYWKENWRYFLIR